MRRFVEKLYAPLRRRRRGSGDSLPVSVVVVVHDMEREAARTLYSLSARYQRHIDPGDYEVIVVDNGSTPRLDPRVVRGLRGNFRLLRLDPAPPSPARAVNLGLAEARGEVIGVLVDGARIATPGLIHFGRHGADLHPGAVVAAPGWYLGHDFQGTAMRFGYDRGREDALLEGIGWPQDGYRLFEIGTLDQSSFAGWFQPLAEANALFMRRGLWDRLGGLDERFDAPGGGLANLDLYSRALQSPGAQLVLLLGEGTFHQLHGGVATNASEEELGERFSVWNAQYEKLRGRPWELLTAERPPMYVGTLPRPALAHFIRGAIAPADGRVAPPLGEGFDLRLWSSAPSPRPADAVTAALVDLAQQEFAAGSFAASAYVARLARRRAPEEPEPRRLLSLTAAALQDPRPRGAEFFYAAGEAHRLLGEAEPAATNYRKALALKPDFPYAHQGLALLRMPGVFYYGWLERLYSALNPETVIEIGVFDGASLALVRPPAVAIGVDPEPRVEHTLHAETHIFAETSDEFFARRAPDALLGGRPLGVGFIDGLHLYEQALRDFVNLETYCGPRSVILLHDTVPLDEVTQSRERHTGFHSGDVWRVVPCLKHYRPDLEIFTVATPPTGLTVVVGLDPSSRVLSTQYEDAVRRFSGMQYSEIEGDLWTALNVVPNDWGLVEMRLRARGILS